MSYAEEQEEANRRYQRNMKLLFGSIVFALTVVIALLIFL